MYKTIHRSYSYKRTKFSYFNNFADNNFLLFRLEEQCFEYNIVVSSAITHDDNTFTDMLNVGNTNKKTGILVKLTGILLIQCFNSYIFKIFAKFIRWNSYSTFYSCHIIHTIPHLIIINFHKFNFNKYKIIIYKFQTVISFNP